MASRRIKTCLFRRKSPSNKGFVHVGPLHAGPGDVVLSNCWFRWAHADSVFFISSLVCSYSVSCMLLFYAFSSPQVAHGNQKLDGLIVTGAFLGESFLSLSLSGLVFVISISSLSSLLSRSYLGRLRACCVCSLWMPVCW